MMDEVNEDKGNNKGLDLYANEYDVGTEVSSLKMIDGLHLNNTPTIMNQHQILVVGIQ